jgi:hypothetical protein
VDNRGLEHVVVPDSPSGLRHRRKIGYFML